MKRLHILAFTDEEIELLYDALDALEDRFETYQQKYEDTLELLHPHPEEAQEAREGIKRLDEDLERVAQLTEEFQPLIKEIRRESAKDVRPSDLPDSEGPDGSGPGYPGRGSNRIRSVPSR